MLRAAYDIQHCKVQITFIILFRSTTHTKNALSINPRRFFILNNNYLFSSGILLNTFHSQLDATTVIDVLY